VAAAYSASNSFDVDVNLTDGQAHYIALYLLGWGRAGRLEQVQLTDVATHTVLDTERISSFGGGTYLVWSITGHVDITFTRLGSATAVVSGIFFDPPAATATAIGRDTTTEGNWIGVYGAQGYEVARSGASDPAYATVNWIGTSSTIWAANPSDPRALQKVGGSGRIAATWWASSSFTVNVNILDGQSHVITLYLLDWDSVWRSERIQFTDAATGSVLDTQTVASFHGGVYVRWQVSGNLVITVTRTGGANAVVSGLFFDAASPLTTAVMSSASTQDLPGAQAVNESHARAQSASTASNRQAVGPGGPSAVGSLASARMPDATDFGPTVGVNPLSDDSFSVFDASSTRPRARRVAAGSSAIRVPVREHLLA
jgi:hypothetical protein